MMSMNNGKKNEIINKIKNEINNLTLWSCGHGHSVVSAVTTLLIWRQKI